MRKRLAAACLFCWGGVAGGGMINQPFPQSEVRLLESPFRRARDVDGAYMLSLEADRLLAGFRANAGLAEKGKVYGGWESRGVCGHTLGHYLSALAEMWAGTGDQRYRERLDYCVKQIAACQAAGADGFVGGMPKGREIFAQLARGHVAAENGFDLNGAWVPWYTQHKLFAGLRDAWLLAGNAQAKAVLVKLGDWADGVCSGLGDADMQAMLATEQGGMMETLADLSAITGDEKYLKLARRFWHKAVLDPLADGRDELTGKHSNTNIPKAIGAARLWELVGDARGKAAADTFWRAVTANRSFVTGSNTDREHFFALGLEAKKLGPEDGETCNVYNMLKLTQHVAGWDDRAAVWDYYERAMFNHILGSIDPDSGGMTYFQSLEAGRFKVYSSAHDSFWCCVGTGMENHARYGEGIYAKHGAGGEGEGLRVNLFVASELDWAEKGITLRQETSFPYEDVTRLRVHVASPTRLKVEVRVPGWAEEGIEATGAVEARGAAGSGYLALDREWRDGDEVAIRMPMGLRVHRAVDDPTMAAFLYGPVVLAAELGREDFPKADVVGDHTMFDYRQVPEVPVMVTSDARLGWMKAEAGKPLHFVTDAGVARLAGGGRGGGALARTPQVRFAPLADVHHQRYGVYLRMMDEGQYGQLQVKLERDRAEAAALAARTVDDVRFGEQQSEADHGVKSEKSHSGVAGQRPWRDARDGGWFSARVKVRGGEEHTLRVTYWGGDGGNRVFDVVVNGQVVGTTHLTAAHAEAFFDADYSVAPAVVGKEEMAEVMFRAHAGSIAGGVFGCRMLGAK